MLISSLVKTLPGPEDQAIPHGLWFILHVDASCVVLLHAGPLRDDSAPDTAYLRHGQRDEHHHLLYHSHGLNKHFRDPSLTEFQMVLATVWVMIISYYLTQTRGIMLLLYMVIFIFGIFRLNLCQFCSLSIFAVLGYGFVIALLRENHPESINIKVELLYMVTLGAVLLWLSFMGSYISILRKKLS